MLTARQITSKYWVTTKSLNDWRKKWIINFKKVNSRFFLYDEWFFEMNQWQLSKNKEENKWIELSEFCKVYDLVKSKDLPLELINRDVLDKMSEEQLSILKQL